MSEEYIRLEINEAGGCDLRMKREFRKGRGNPSQFRKHVQFFNLYSTGLGLALQFLKARDEMGPEFDGPKRKSNIPPEKLREFIEMFEAEIMQ